MTVVKQPIERYRLRGVTRYLGVRGWERDNDAKKIAKLARKRGVKVMAQYDLAQNVTYLYVPEISYEQDARLILQIEAEEGL